MSPALVDRKHYLHFRARDEGFIYWIPAIENATNVKSVDTLYYSKNKAIHDICFQYIEFVSNIAVRYCLHFARYLEFFVDHHDDHKAKIWNKW